MADKNLLYKRRILKQLYFASTLSCSDLSAHTKISLPLTTTKMVNELIERKLYHRDRLYAPSTGGRRPLIYSIIPDIMYTVAVAIDQLFTRVVSMDMHKKQVTGIEKFELHLAR